MQKCKMSVGIFFEPGAGGEEEMCVLGIQGD
jgi:hypothetical protein